MSTTVASLIGALAIDVANAVHCARGWSPESVQKHRVMFAAAHAHATELLAHAQALLEELESIGAKPLGTDPPAVASS